VINYIEKLEAGTAPSARECLLVGTTRLDAQRQVIWDMGAIVASGHPDFPQILRASASIPVAFNPVYIKVKAAGQEYDEMHVDGASGPR
jgi:predicted acylesterase/phospholipase RssA